MVWPAKWHLTWGHCDAVARADDELADGKDPVILAVPRSHLTIGQRQGGPVAAAERLVAPVHPGVAPFSACLCVRRNALMCPAATRSLAEVPGVSPGPDPGNVTLGAAAPGSRSG